MNINYYDVSNAVREVNNLLNTDVLRHIVTSAYYFIDCQRMVDIEEFSTTGFNNLI